MRRLPQLLLFVAYAAWYFASDALALSSASGLAMRFQMGPGRALLAACFHLFLLILGFVALQTIARQSMPLARTTGLPRRASARFEWAAGVAIGWGMVIASLLPLLLSGMLRARMERLGGGWFTALLSLVTLGVASLTAEIAFRGHPFESLVQAAGPSLAVLLLMISAGFVAWRDPFASHAGVVAAMLVTALFCLGWLRTHAIWLSWGVHFGITASLGLLFGLPVAGKVEPPAVVHAVTRGPDWLTGGDFGPGAALFSLIVLLAGLIVLYRVTRDFAWRYTHVPIVAGGHEVNVAPPAAHATMEQQAAGTPALVQILPATPRSISALDPTEMPTPPPVPDRIH